MVHKKAVVTGGAGFIGSNLADELVKRGYSVVILDNLSSGKMENIQSLIDKHLVEFVRGSILDQPLLHETFHDAEFVFHLAAVPSVPRSVKDPQASHEANATGTLNVLVASRDCEIKKLIYSSSSSVYGDTPTLPKREDMLLKPESPYAVSKLAGEYYCQVFRKVYGLPTVSLRYFNVYGPRQAANSQYAAVIPKFIDAIFQDKPPVIFGDGEQTRDFTFVKDAVEANILSAESEGAAGVFNVGSGRRVTINALTALIINELGSHLQPLHEPERPGDVKHSLADIVQAGNFGYRPQWELNLGIQETIRSFNYAKQT